VLLGWGRTDRRLIGLAQTSAGYWAGDAGSEGPMSERNAVLAIARENARGGMSGASISSRIYTIFTFGEGKNARDQESLRRAAGPQSCGA
jgi:hypothetical protein